VDINFWGLVLRILCPHTVVAVGRTAAAVLTYSFPSLNFVGVRHPSFGGKTEFISGIKAAGIA
jgi:hypothetical protein